MFTTLAKAVANQQMTKEAEVLEESAVALAQKRNALQIYLPSTSSGEQREVITGEEDERTVLELTCSAYVFDRDSRQWKGIGQCYLHLNDTVCNDQGDTTSRIIIRLQSTRRVVVNTRIWSGIPIAHVAENKAVRVGALSVNGQDRSDGDNSIRTYMLRFATAESSLLLFEALQERRNSAERLETLAKRPRLDEQQTSTELSAEVTPGASVKRLSYRIHTFFNCTLVQCILLMFKCNTTISKVIDEVVITSNIIDWRIPQDLQTISLLCIFSQVCFRVTSFKSRSNSLVCFYVRI